MAYLPNSKMLTSLQMVAIKKYGFSFLDKRYL